MIFFCSNSTMFLCYHNKQCTRRRPYRFLFLCQLWVSGILLVFNICLLKVPNCKMLKIHISMFNTTLYFSVPFNLSFLVAYWNITSIQDPSSFKKKFIHTTSFYFSSIGNLKEVSTLHILGKSIQCNNILKNKLQTFNLFKIFTLLIHMYDSKKYTQWMIWKIHAKWLPERCYLQE